MKIVADTYAWVEVFLGSPRGEKASRAIQEAELLLTPGIVLAELAKKYIREGHDYGTVSKRIEDIANASELSQVNRAIALASAEASAELETRAKEFSLTKPGLFDAIILATARVNNAKVMTGDQHFRGLPETLWIGE